MSVRARLEGVARSFGPVRVLEGVTLDVRAGEVHVLAGENGAGKSTLIRILAGLDRPDFGRVERSGEVAVIHQELSLAPSLTIEENLFLSRGGRLVRAGEERRESVRLLARVGLDADPRTRVASLPLAARQLVEIAKALSREAGVLVMDEATSALGEPEARRLFSLVRDLRDRGAAIVAVTHRLEEIYQLADRISVLRDGRLVAGGTPCDLPREALVRAMVGREVASGGPRHVASPGAGAPPALRVRSLVVPARSRGEVVVGPIDLEVRAGEIVGLAGLEGSGVSRLLHAIAGDARSTWARGSIEVGGAPSRAGGVRASIARGVVLVPRDRKSAGLCLGRSVEENLALPVRGWGRSPRSDRRRAMQLALEFGVRCAGVGQEARVLSGGNQQKVVLARWAKFRPRVYLLDDPTRGVDIGAKGEIHARVRRWAGEGAGVLMASSDLPELLDLSDRVMAVHRGRAMATLAREGATPERVIAAAMGEGAAA